MLFVSFTGYSLFNKIVLKKKKKKKKSYGFQTMHNKDKQKCNKKESSWWIEGKRKIKRKGIGEKAERKKYIGRAL